MLKNMFIFLLAFILIVANLYSKNYLYEDLQNELKNLKPDESKVANIKDLFWQKEGGMFSLDSGKMYFMQPINDRISCAIFIGKGSFAFTPPTKVEKTQLERLMKTQFFQTELEAMVIFFTDSTYEFIKENYGIQNGEVPNKVEDIYSRARQYILSTNHIELDEDLVRAFLPSYRTGLFHSFYWKNIARLKEHPYMWVCDPLAEEEVRFAEGNWHAGFGNYIDIINQFDCQSILKSKQHISKDEIRIEKYTIESNFEQDLDFSCKSFVEFQALKTGVEWINFSLSYKLNVDSIIDWKGNRLKFTRPEESFNLWVRFDEKIIDSCFYQLKFYYKGKQIDGYGDILFLLSSSNWYPRYGYREKAYFDLKYKTPKRYKFCSVGKKISWEEKDNFIYSHFQTTKKGRNISFNIGDFFERVLEADSVTPKLSFYYRNSDQVDALADDIKLSIEFFNNIYGTYLTEDMTVSEIPAYYGEAFPGFLHLSLIAFLSNDKSYGFNENFCAHEVSHQWWGIGLDFVSYRDQWLSEGFASYSGILYTQLTLKNNEAFFRSLIESKKELFNLRKSLFFDGIKAGPIALGYRNNTEGTRGDYNIIVYNKGAWVLHMLRNLFIDFDTMDDKIFFQMIKEFFMTYKDKNACTQDFINIVNKYAGTDMTWFFEQWVESNEMPKYTFGYKKEQTPDGKYKVTARVKQEGVNSKFMMPVPVKIDYGESFRVLRINVTKPFIEFEFPIFDTDPKEFILNAYESVLCEVEYDDYEDIQP